MGEFFCFNSDKKETLFIKELDFAHCITNKSVD